ncbi:MAG: Dabb family protein [Acidimicrobiales bacterium]
MGHPPPRRALLLEAGRVRRGREGVLRGTGALPARIPDIRSYRFGPDLRLGGGNEDFALVADFDDADAYRRYAEHPAHRHLLAERLWPILAGRHSVQYEA